MEGGALFDLLVLGSLYLMLLYRADTDENGDLETDLLFELKQGDN